MVGRSSGGLAVKVFVGGDAWVGGGQVELEGGGGDVSLEDEFDVGVLVGGSLGVFADEFECAAVGVTVGLMAGLAVG